MKADFSQLIETGASGVFRAHSPLPDSALAAAAQRGMRVERIGLAGVRDKNAFMNLLARVLKFPDYFGHNWDAFYDCLIELEHGPGEGTLLWLQDASGFARAEAEEFAAAVDVFQDAADYWADEKKTLIVIVELQAPVLAPELPEISARPG